MSNFDPNSVNNLVGLWDFLSGNELSDTGLDDGVAQNGWLHGGASVSGGQLHTDGRGDYFDVDGEIIGGSSGDSPNAGDDDPFDMAVGTIEVQFTQHAHVGTSPDTLVNRGEYDDKNHEGFFNISVTQHGQVQVQHYADGNNEMLETSASFFSPGDLVNVRYSWDASNGVSLVVENLTTGASETVSSNQTGLTMAVGDEDDESFTFGAREVDDADYDGFFNGSIDHVAIYESGSPDPDGAVDGEASGEVMELGYDDSNAPTDQGGDMITNDDDVIFGNGGDDTIDGAAGDDTIYGDSGSTGTPTREIFKWSDGPGFADDADAPDFTQNTGSANITFTTVSESKGVETEYETTLQNTDDLDPDAGERSSLSSTLNGDPNSATYRWESDQPVENVEFRINDIDGDGRVTIRAYDEFGNPVEVTLSDAGSGLALSNTDGVAGNDTVTSIDNNYTNDDADEHSVLVSIAGPVSRWEIVHNQDGGNNTGINVTDIAFDAGSGFGDPGNDVIQGGKGDDLIFGEQGDDTLDGGEGTDTSDGGDGDDTFSFGSRDEANGDVIVGGNGPDEDDDNDVLDLRGLGRVEILETTDGSDNGATTGTVNFLDASGKITGSLKFSQIEQILTDPQNQDPTANDDEYEVDEDDTVTFDPTLNDSDPDGDPLDVIDITDPANGTITDNGDGTFTYTPDPDFNGTDTVTYTVSDGNGGTQTATITFNVAPVNDDPDATDDNASTNQGTPVIVPVLANDGDIDGDTLAIDSFTQPPNGTVTDNGDGTLTYTPDPAFVGTDTFTYTVSDGNGGFDTATVDIRVDDVLGPVDGLDTSEDMGPGYTDLEGDQIDGTDGIDDVIFGNGGDDTIDSGEGDDLVDGGAGDDTFVLAESGAGIDNDTIVGGETDEDDGGDVLDASDVNDDMLLDLTAPETGTLTDGTDTTEFSEIERIILGAGDDTVIGSDGDDWVDSGGGDDLMEGGDGDDTLISGDGLDTVDGGAGNDSLVGGDEADDITGGSGNDTLVGGRGGDTLDGGDDDDLILGGNDKDLLIGGDGDDTIEGSLGDDTIEGGDGSDVVRDLDGDNVIDTSGGKPLPDLGFPAYGPFLAVPADSDPDDDRDTVITGDGNDHITTGDDADTISGGGGNDTIDSGIDDDVVDGGSGDDLITTGEGNDDVQGGAGNDTIYGGLGPSVPDVINIPDAPDGGPFGPDPEPGNGRDTIDGGRGNDVIFGEDDDDLIFGGIGADSLDGGVDDDTIYGGSGQDDITGGQGMDSLSGGDDRDEFFIDDREDAYGDTVDGGDGGNDIDRLDLRGLGPFEIVNETVDADGDSTSGEVNFLNADGSIAGTMVFREIEKLVICFTPGTVIATPRGETAVEALQVGDKVITRDHGIQEICWIGRKRLSTADLLADSQLRPILIRKDALGHGLPERDMMVSPNHRMLVANEQTHLLFDEREVLVAAKHLAGQPGIEQRHVRGVEYIHVMFENHEVILGDGAWSESFQPGDHSLGGLVNAQRNEIFRLFPELEQQEGLRAYGSARRSLKAHEAELIRL